MPTIPTAVHALTTPDRVKVRLNVTVTNFDTLLGQLVASATDFIESACNRRFLQTTYTNELYDGANVDGSPKSYLILRNTPLASVSAIQYRTGAKSSPVWVDFQADTWQEDLRLGVIRVGLPSGFQNIRVSYVAGYKIDFANEYTVANHTLPHDLSDLCERLVTKLFKRRESEGKTVESFNQSSVNWGAFLEDGDRETIANYSRTVFA